MAARFSGYGMPLSSLDAQKPPLSSAVTREAQEPRVQFAAIAPFLAEKMRFQSGMGLAKRRCREYSLRCTPGQGVDIPASRGFGFHVIELQPE